MRAALLKLAAAVVLLFASSFASDACAVQFCVDTEAELSGALVVSQINSQQNEIRLVSGSYTMPDGWSNSGTSPFPQALKLSGGWNNDCSTRVTVNPSSTTIQGQSSSNSRWLFTAEASLIIDGLSFVQTAGLVLASPFDCTPFGQEFLIRRVRVSNSISGVGLWSSMTAFTSCHDVRIENSLVVDGALNGIEIQCFNNALGDYRLINNTVRDHGGVDFVATYDSQSCAGNSIGADSLHNNVFGSIQLDANTPRAHNNIYSSLSSLNGGGFFSGSSDNLVGDPQLDPVNYRPVEPGSPAINSGTSNVPGGLPAADIAGDPRTIGGIPDRGAYESSVVPPGPFVLTVTSNANSGTGTLREAIGQANASPGLNLIQFDIPGTCPRLITLAAPLPDLTEDVIINGFSQPGSAWNTFDFGNNANLCIGVVGSQLVEVPYALRVPANSSATLKVRGIGFGGFDDGGGLFGEAAIYLQGGSGHEIQGNQFGGPFHATTLAGNSEGIRLMNNATSALIGGSSPGHRNTISGSSLAGVHVIGSASGGRQIVNNYIGTNPSGVSAVGNLDGIRLVQSADNDILDNLVSGNTRDGVVIVGEQATSNLVAGNRIGGRRGGFYLCGVPPLPACPPTMTNRKGIFIDSGASNNTIGVGGVDGAPNQIRFSTQHGIRILSGTRNRMLSNTLWDNGSVASEYEIDLGSFGFDPVDADCGAVADAKANRGQNRPVLESALGGASEQSVVFAGELSSCTHDGGFSSVYRIQLFASNACDGNGAGPGQYFLGDVNVVMPGPVQTDTTVAFSGELEHPWLDLEGKYITATATDLLGNTSEFSQCVQVQAPDALFHDRFEQ